MDFIPHLRDTLAIGVAYALGCLTAGYYLVRFKTGQDIRRFGSGNVGATNVARRLGRTGFVLTLLGDLTKGALAVGIADALHTDPTVRVLALVTVIVGHIWPVQLHFRGGKGAATFLGALLAADPAMVLVLGGLCAATLVLLRRFTLSGLAAVAMLPWVAFLMDASLDMVFGLSAAALLILIAHRSNIREEIARVPAERRRRPGRRIASKQ